MENNLILNALNTIIKNIDDISTKKKQEAKELIDGGKFDDVQNIMNLIKEVDNFQIKVKELKQEWIKLSKSITIGKILNGDVILLEMEYGRANAVAEYNKNQIRILAGSTVRKLNFASLADNVREIREKAIENGILVETEENDLLKLAKPIILKSPSAAAQFVAGCSESGLRRWKVKGKGITLKRWISNNN